MLTLTLPFGKAGLTHSLSEAATGEEKWRVKNPQAQKPDREVQRGEDTMNAATQKEHGDVHQSPPTRHGHLLPEQAPQL